MVGRRKLAQTAGSGNLDLVAVELGRIAKLFALYLLRDVPEESKKVTRLHAVGFSTAEVAALLDKSEENVLVQLSQSRKRKKPTK